MMYGYPHMYWYGSGFGFLPFLFNIFIIILVISLVVSLFQSRNSDENEYEGSDTDEETALEILKKRYAKGDLTKKEFEQMKQDIR